MQSDNNPRGSMWHRWDPHIHAPGTALNDQFKDETFEQYLDRIESCAPAIEALGITDYLDTSCYERVLAAKKDEGRLADVPLIFPNIEMRLSVGTIKEKGINLHLLVSPDDPDHLEQVHRFLRRLHFEAYNDKFDCNRVDLVRLGKAHDPSVTEDDAAFRIGVNQFKVDFRQLKGNFEASPWMRNNCLIAVAASSSDGSSGLQTDDSAFDALRKDIESFAHLLFSATPSVAKFWLGDGPLSIDQLVKDYGGTRPCIHGSDAHKPADVGAPDQDRFTWIKGDLIFESLRQACIEPGLRVVVGSQPPDLLSPSVTIDQVSTAGLPWLLDGGQQINPGLVAVIGARGSGKTALADLIAHGAGSSTPIAESDTFVHRAREFLGGGATVSVHWTDDSQVAQMLDNRPSGEEEVHYLSQKFVERLCSAESVNDELIDEIHKVVFESHDASERTEATTFSELLVLRVGDTRDQRQYLRERLDRLSEAVLAERRVGAELVPKQDQLKILQAEAKANQEARSKIVSAGEKERADYYERLRTAIERRDHRLQGLDRRRQMYVQFEAEQKRYTERVFVDLASELRQKFEPLGLTENEWAEFQIQFSGDPAAVIAKRLAALEKHASAARATSTPGQVTSTLTPDQLDACAIAQLKAEFEKVSKDIGVDRQNAQRLVALNKRMTTLQTEVQKVEREIATCKGSSGRLIGLAKERADRYEEFFALVIDEEAALVELYGPLESRLEAAGDTVGNLRLVVVRQVDSEAWAEQGEELLDLRKTGEFKGRGSLAAFAEELLVPAWRSGTAADVRASMTEFRDRYNKAILEQSKVESDDPAYGQWTVDVGRWLYSTEHISVTYSFEYEGVPLSQLSPGTRGIVLLLLYLALDLDDHRPLIIDQPEENLDPRSVFTELVELFRAARYRRQVIIVTHNAILVVNTDVDQVIVATTTRSSDGGPPQFSYRSGGLEDASIRADVCQILEGGERAFRERAKRLRVSDY